MKEYRITHIDDLLLVPEEHLDDCLEDLREAITVARATRDCMTEINRCINGEEKLEFKPSVFTYKPDGEKKIVIHVGSPTD